MKKTEENPLGAGRPYRWGRKIDTTTIKVPLDLAPEINEIVDYLLSITNERSAKITLKSMLKTLNHAYDKDNKK